MPRKRFKTPSKQVKQEPKKPPFLTRRRIGFGLTLTGLAAAALLARHHFIKPEKPISSNIPEIVEQIPTLPNLRIKPDIPFELKPVYANMVSNVQNDLLRLKELDGKQNLTKVEEEEIPLLLNQIGRNVYNTLGTEYEKQNQGTTDTDIYTKLGKFKQEFGHEAPGWYPDQGIYFNCFSNAISQNVVFSTLGKDKVGVLMGPTHGIPTVSVRGKIYAIDPITLHLQRAPTVDQFVNEAKQAYMNPNHPGHEFAIADFPEPYGFTHSMRNSRQFIGISSTLAGIHGEYGRTLFQQGRIDEAKVHLNLAITLQPKHLTSRMDLGAVLLNEKNYDGARRVFNDALKVNPRSSLPYAGLVRTDLDQEKYSDAITHLKAAIARGHPKSDQLRQMIPELEKQAKDKNGRDFFKQLLDKKP